MEPTGWKSRWRRLTSIQKMSVGSLLFLLLVLPIAVIVALKPTRLIPRATPATPPEQNTAIVALFHPLPTVTLGSLLDLEVVLGAPNNDVTAAEVHMTFDPMYLEVQSVDIQEHLPQVLEATVINGGRISFVVGSNPETPQRGSGTLAKITFRTIGLGNTRVDFDESTQVAAVGFNSNVLYTSTPSNITITTGATTTPSPTATPSATPTPTVAITPTPSTADLTILTRLQGITRANDTLDILVQVLPEGGGGSPSRNITFISDSNGVYRGVYTGLPRGLYSAIYLDVPGYLRQNIGGEDLRGGNSTIDVTSTPLRPGDISGNDGIIDIFDYNKLVEEFGPRMPVNGSAADLDRDGDVDIFDYNLIVENFGRRVE